MKLTINLKVPLEDDKYIRSVASGICPIAEVYRTIVSSFCDDMRLAQRRKKSAKKKPKRVSKDSTRGRRRSTGGKGSKEGRV